MKLSAIERRLRVCPWYPKEDPFWMLSTGKICHSAGWVDWELSGTLSIFMRAPAQWKAIHLMCLIPAAATGRTSESLRGCSSPSVQGSEQEFHTVIFVPKDTKPCQQGCYRGARFHSMPSDNGRGLLQWPWHVMLLWSSIVCHHYSLLVNLKHVTCGRSRLGELALVVSLIALANVLFLDGCLCCCKLQFYDH